jgi:hypothetical protein
MQCGACEMWDTWKDEVTGPPFWMLWLRVDDIWGTVVLVREVLKAMGAPPEVCIKVIGGSGQLVRIYSVESQGDDLDWHDLERVERLSTDRCAVRVALRHWPNRPGRRTI